jgi:hypothetical protein
VLASAQQHILRLRILKSSSCYSNLPCSCSNCCYVCADTCAALALRTAGSSSGRNGSGSFDDDDSVDSSSEQAEEARDAAVAERRNSALLHPPSEHSISVPGMVLHHVTGHEIAYLTESAEGDSTAASSAGAPGSADSGNSSGFSQVNLSTPSIADQETFHKVSAHCSWYYL